VYFRALLGYFNSRLAAFVPAAAKTVRRWLIAEFSEWKQRLKDDICSSKSKVSISFDMWTSPNFMSYIAVHGHFIDSSGRRRQDLLAFRRVEGSHTAENIKEVVVFILREYQIDTEDKMGYFMLDNATNNDLAVKLILQELFPHWSNDRIKRRRLRCLGHVVNLAAQRFIHGGNTEEAFQELRDSFMEEEAGVVLGQSQRLTTLGTLHSLIRYIRMTPERREAFANTTVMGEYEKYNGLEVCEGSLVLFFEKEELKSEVLASTPIGLSALAAGF
jgi:hypothetical protein